MIRAPKINALGWTREAIADMLATNDKAVGRALLALYDRQTNDEQVGHTTKHANGRGFGAFDAEIMTSMALFYQRTGFLTAKQLAFLRANPGKSKTSRIARYAGQLTEVANAKMEALIHESEYR